MVVLHTAFSFFLFDIVTPFCNQLNIGLIVTIPFPYYAGNTGNNKRKL